MFKALHYEKWVLDNGLNVVLHQNRHLPLVSLSFFTPVGKAQNPLERPGLAAMTARLLDEGTEGYTSQQISELVENSGSELSTFSEQELTAITFQLRSTDLEMAASVIAEMVRRPIFPRERFRIEQQKVLDHIAAMHDDPQIVGSQLLNREIYHGTPLAEPVLGLPESVSAMTSDELFGFQRRHFAPQRSTLVLVGDFERLGARAIIEQAFSDWANPDSLSLPEFVFPTPAGPVLRREPMPKEQVNIFIGHLGTQRKNPDHYALQVMDVILGGGPGFTARIPRRLRDEQGLAYVAYSDITGSAGLYPGRFAAYIGTSPETWRPALEGLKTEIARLVDAGVDDEELRTAQAYLTGSFVFEFQSNSALARLLAYCELFDLGNGYANEYSDYIRRVTREDVLRVAQRYLDTVNYTTVLVGSM